MLPMLPYARRGEVEARIESRGGCTGEEFEFEPACLHARCAPLAGLGLEELEQRCRADARHEASVYEARRRESRHRAHAAAASGREWWLQQAPARGALEQRRMRLLQWRVVRVLYALALEQSQWAPAAAATAITSAAAAYSGAAAAANLVPPARARSRAPPWLPTSTALALMGRALQLVVIGSGGIGCVCVGHHGDDGTWLWRRLSHFLVASWAASPMNAAGDARALAAHSEHAAAASKARRWKEWVEARRLAHALNARLASDAEHWWCATQLDSRWRRWRQHAATVKRSRLSLRRAARCLSEWHAMRTWSLWCTRLFRARVLVSRAVRQARATQVGRGLECMHTTAQARARQAALSRRAETWRVSRLAASGMLCWRVWRSKRVAAAFQARRACTIGIARWREATRLAVSAAVIEASAADTGSQMLPRRRRIMLRRGWEAIERWQALHRPYVEAMARGAQLCAALVRRRRAHGLGTAVQRWRPEAARLRALRAKVRAVSPLRDGFGRMRLLICKSMALTHWRAEAKRLKRRQHRVRNQIWHMSELQNGIESHERGYGQATPPIDQLLRMGVEAKLLDPTVDTRAGSASIALSAPRFLRIMSAGARQRRVALLHELAELSPTPQTELFRVTRMRNGLLS